MSQEKQIHLIKTAHVSKASVLEVQETIEQLQPDTVCIELDQRRLDNLFTPQDLSSLKLLDVIKQKKVWMVVSNYILANYQKQLASGLDTQVGDEMRMAVKSAQKIGAEIVCIDRDIQITFKRIWSFLSFKEKIHIVSGLFSVLFENTEISEQEIENLKQSDFLEDALKEISDQLPTVARILIKERDQYMANLIKQSPGQNIVAVVGAAHGPGIEYHLDQPYVDPSELTTIKQTFPWGKIWSWAFPLLIIAGIFFSASSLGGGISSFGTWMLWVALASALGALISFAHPLTILVSFLTAPISTLSPVFAVGWFAGLSEAYFRSPTVGDFNTLNQDIKSIKTVYKNNILRTLLIMLITSLFSSLVTLWFAGGLLSNFF